MHGIRLIRRNRVYIGKRFGFKTYLPCHKRFPNLFIHSDQASLQDRYWLHLLKIEASLSCSSIVITQKKRLIEKIKENALGERNVLFLDPDHARTMSLNPVENSGDFKFDGLVRSLLHKGYEWKVATLLNRLLKLVASEEGGRMTLPALQGIAGEGVDGLQFWLNRKKTSLRLALLDDLARMGKTVTNHLLSEIAQGMAFLAGGPVKRLFLEPTIYAPIFFHEESVLLVYVSQKHEQAQRILNLICQSLFLQIAGYSKKCSLKPIFIHFDWNSDLYLPDEILMKFKTVGVGLTSYCKDRGGLDEGIATGIRIINEKQATITEGTRTRKFTPVFIENN